MQAHLQQHQEYLIIQNINNKTKTNWTNGGVTYQATIPRNSFGNGASSKEIKIRGFDIKNTGERSMVNFYWR